jgi:O-antigen ligase
MENIVNYQKQNTVQNKPYKYLCLLCASIVPLLVTGPFLPDLLVSLTSLWFIYYTLKNKIYYIYQNKFFYFFISFCIVCIISSLLSDDILLSFESSLFYFRIGILALLISYLIEKNQDILNYFYYFFIITFSVLVIDGYYQFINGVNLFGQKLQFVGGSPRVSSLFGDETVMDSYLARLFPLLFALFIKRENKTKFEVYFIAFLFICIDILIYLGGGRTSFMFLNLSTVFIILFIDNFKKFRIITFIISLALITILTLNDNRLLNRYVKFTAQQIGLTETSSKKYIFSQSHDSHIRTAYNMFLDQPILGVGPKLFRVKCKDTKYLHDVVGCSTHPHNFYVQLLAETGIIGFSFLFGTLIYFIYQMIKFIKYKYINKRLIFSDYQICLLSCLLITIWPFSPNGSFFNNLLMIFYSLHIGFLNNKILIDNKIDDILSTDN